MSTNTGMSGESQRQTEPQIIGVTLGNYYWCMECASLPDAAEEVQSAADVSMRGHTLTRCSFCGRKLSEVPA